MRVPPAPVTTGLASETLIPPGTTMVIRADEGISADRADPGRRYPAHVAQDVINRDGNILIPRGSPAELVVLQSTGGGAVGTSRLELSLASIDVNGRRYTVTSDVAEQSGTEGLGANRRTAETVGGGAALGALIGAVAGGGSGALAGAAIGAGGGAVAQVLTRGDAVRVPAETVLTFQLERGIRLR
jgi:hypothetical protein